MITWTRRLALAGLLAVAAGGAAADVSVTFSNADGYGAMPTASWDRERVLKDLSAYFAKLGAKLPPGTDLKIDVLDLDLAGRVRPNFRGGEELRILNGGADWPHMHLRYTLTQGGRVLAQGDDEISNMNYLERMSRVNADPSWRYEKQMIDDWFASKIVNGKLATR